MTTKALTTAAALLVSLSAVCHSRADDADAFYKGRQIRFIVGHVVGNDYDVGTRLLARYLPKHVPGHPTFVVQNMPQGAGVAAANFLYGQAPRDGSVMGTFSRNYPTQAILHQANVEGDPRRFSWIGATSFPGRICVAGPKTAIKTPADLLSHELIVGGGLGPGSSNSIIPTVINRVLGTKFRVIQGDKGSQDAVLAIERGELEGVCASLGQFRAFEQQIKSGKLRILFRAEEAEMPQLPGVPSIYELAKTTEQRQLMRFIFSSTEFGRPYVLPPDAPAERVQLMRRALRETVEDPDLIAEADKMKLDMAYRAPEHLEQLVTHLYETPPELIKHIKELFPEIR
jgi:tripartite-type tricarboxylate transporter receptor subunit TctC